MVVMTGEEPGVPESETGGAQVDTFTRTRMTPDQIRQVYARTCLLVSSVWSDYTTLTPVEYLRWDEEKRAPVVRYLSAGASPWDEVIDLNITRVYRTVVT